MMQKQWKMFLIVLGFALVGAAEAKPVVFDEEFAGTSLGSEWDWYGATGWSQSVGGGTLTITANTSGTAGAGLALNVPIDVGSDDGVLDVYMRIKNDVTSGNLRTNFGFTTSNPGGPDGLGCSGWAYYEFQGYNDNDPAPGSNTRIYIDGSKTTDNFFGNVQNYGLSDGEYGYVDIRMYTNPGEERFAVLLSSNGTNWTIAGNHYLTASEIEGLTQGEYYLLLRTVAIGATQATMDIDHIWAEAVPEPATIGLLGIGGIFAVIRHRKSRV